MVLDNIMDTITKRFWQCLQNKPDLNIEVKKNILCKIDPHKDIPGPIRREIKTYNTCYALKYPDYKTEIKLYGKKKYCEQVLKQVDHIHDVLYLFSKVIKTKYTNDIHIYLTNYEKELPEVHEDCVIKPYHVNSSILMYRNNSKKNTIIIYRKEEWFKVFIYELLRGYRMDAFDSEPYLNLSESFFEAWSILLQCIFYANSKSDKYSKFKSILIESLEMEIVFSMVQANKLLKHMYSHYDALIQEHKHDVNMNMMRGVIF